MRGSGDLSGFSVIVNFPSLGNIANASRSVANRNSGADPCVNPIFNCQRAARRQSDAIYGDGYAPRAFKPLKKCILKCVFALLAKICERALIIEATQIYYQGCSGRRAAVVKSRRAADYTAALPVVRSTDPLPAYQPMSRNSPRLRSSGFLTLLVSSGVMNGSINTLLVSETSQ